jgi:hypothetical protein
VKRRAAVSRGARKLCGISLVAAATTAVMHRPVVATGNPTIAALLQERDRLAGNTDALRRKLQTRALGIETQVWTRAALQTLEDQLGPAWTWQCRAGDPIEHATLTAQPGELGQWSTCRQAIHVLDEQRGAVLESLELRAEGQGRARRFTELTLGVRFVRPAKTPAAPPPFRPNPPLAGSSNPPQKTP